MNPTAFSTFLSLFLLGLLTLSTGKQTQAQQVIGWNDLKDVRYTDPANPELAGDPLHQVPHFGPEVKALAGKEVEIRGYMLPLTVDNKLYILSQYPFTECFFCGGAGKETVIELKLKKESKFDIDESIVMQGTFRLNDNPLELSYVLEEAEPMKK